MVCVWVSGSTFNSRVGSMNVLTFRLSSALAPTPGQSGSAWEIPSFFKVSNTQRAVNAELVFLTLKMENCFYAALAITIFILTRDMYHHKPTPSVKMKIVIANAA